MPVASILRDEDDHNYAKAKAAFTSLSKKGAEYEDDKIWFYTDRKSTRLNSSHSAKSRMPSSDLYAALCVSTFQKILRELRPGSGEILRGTKSRNRCV